jgi:hypothetical protein
MTETCDEVGLSEELFASWISTVSMNWSNIHALWLKPSAEMNESVGVQLTNLYDNMTEMSQGFAESNRKALMHRADMYNEVASIKDSVTSSTKLILGEMKKLSSPQGSYTVASELTTTEFPSTPCASSPTFLSPSSRPPSSTHEKFSTHEKSSTHEKVNRSPVQQVLSFTQVTQVNQSKLIATLADLWYGWYNDFMYNTPMLGMTPHDQEMYTKYTKMIAYLRCFLKDGAVRTERPTNELLAHQWQVALMAEARYLENACVQFQNKNRHCFEVDHKKV